MWLYVAVCVCVVCPCGVINDDGSECVCNVSELGEQSAAGWHV